MSHTNDNNQFRLIGYICISPANTYIDTEILDLRHARCQNIFKDIVPYSSKEKPNFKGLLSTLEKGDMVVVPSISRTGRDLKDLLDTIKSIEAKGCYIKSLKETWFNTYTNDSSLITDMISSFVVFEKNLLLEKQQEGVNDAKERGVKFGRKLDPLADVDLAMNLYTEGRYTVTKICTLCHISRNTFYRELDKRGLGR